MRLFNRIGDIIAANLNDWVDRFEDPEVMLKQALREMETMIEATTASAARAIAGERLLAKELADHERNRQNWNNRAEEAVSHGDDDLARQAIIRGHEHEAMAHALIDQRSSAERTAQALRGQIHAMRAKQAEARRKLASLTSLRQLASSSRAFQGITRETNLGPNGFARFDRMHHQIEQAEAEAEALGELYDSNTWSQHAEAESIHQTRRVEEALSAIKLRLRK